MPFKLEIFIYNSFDAGIEQTKICFHCSQSSSFIILTSHIHHILTINITPHHQHNHRQHHQHHVISHYHCIITHHHTTVNTINITSYHTTTVSSPHPTIPSWTAVAGSLRRRRWSCVSAASGTSTPSAAHSTHSGSSVRTHSTTRWGEVWQGGEGNDGGDDVLWNSDRSNVLFGLFCIIVIYQCLLKLFFKDGFECFDK